MTLTATATLPASTSGAPESADQERDPLELRNGPRLLLCDADCAHLVGCSSGTWWRWVSLGNAPAPFVTSFGKQRWRRADIERWIDLGCPTAREFEGRSRFTAEAQRTQRKAGELGSRQKAPNQGERTQR